MLHLLDESLEAFLREVVPLSEQQVDVTFVAPDGEWAAGVSQPTVDLYLWDVRPNLRRRELGEQVVDLGDGRQGRRQPLPLVDCRYLVTAWTSDVRDEHSLLGALLRAFLLHPVIGREHLAGSLRDLDTVPNLELRSGDPTANSDFWSAVGGQLKPGLDLALTVPIDAAAAESLATHVADVDVRVVNPVSLGK